MCLRPFPSIMVAETEVYSLAIQTIRIIGDLQIVFVWMVDLILLLLTEHSPFITHIYKHCKFCINYRTKLEYRYFSFCKTLFESRNFPYRILGRAFQGGSYFPSYLIPYSVCFDMTRLQIISVTYGIIETTTRQDIEEYPEFILREAILNSLIHRDYSMLSSNIVNIYKFRLII